MATHYATFSNNELCVTRANAAASNPSWSNLKVDSDVWGMRNTLNLKETDSDYATQLKSLIQLYDNGGALSTTVTDWLTATSNAINAAQLKAINDFVSDVGATVLAKIIRFNPFVGTSSTAQRTPLIGASTDTLVGSPTFTSAGLPINGSSQYLNTGIALTGLGSNIGGLGAYYTALTDATGTLIGCSDSVQGQFYVRYDTLNNRNVGNFGGVVTTNSALQTSITTAPAKQYLHVERRGATDLELYNAGASVATNVTNLSVTSTSDVITVGCNLADTVAGDYATGTIGCYCLTNGTMDDSNVSRLASSIKTLMGKLGRG